MADGVPDSTTPDCGIKACPGEKGCRSGSETGGSQNDCGENNCCENGTCCGKADSGCSKSDTGCGKDIGSDENCTVRRKTGGDSGSGKTCPGEEEARKQEAEAGKGDHQQQECKAGAAAQEKGVSEVHDRLQSAC